jgi:hypothetical protein
VSIEACQFSNRRAMGAPMFPLSIQSLFSSPLALFFIIKVFLGILLACLCRCQRNVSNGLCQGK